MHVEHEALAEKTRAQEAQVAKQEEDCRALREDMEMLRGVRANLEMEVQAEHELSHTVAQASWEAMEGTVVALGVLSPPRHHSVDEMGVTLGRLHHAVEVCLPAARAYRYHYARVAWTTTFASLDKAGCVHLHALAMRSMALATTEEVAIGHHRTRKAGQVFIQDLWTPWGRDVAMASLCATQAHKKKGKALADVAKGAELAATHGDKV